MPKSMTGPLMDKSKSNMLLFIPLSLCFLSTHGFLINNNFDSKTKCPSSLGQKSSYISTGTKCMEFVLYQQKDWVHAQTYCRNRGGYLVTIENDFEQSIIKDHLSTTGFNGRGVWIGLHDDQTEGQFVWDSGKPLTYTNWASGQPDDKYYMQSQDCVLFYGPYAIGRPGWHDQGCSGVGEFDGWVCEYTGSTPQPQHSTSLPQLTQLSKHVSGCPAQQTITSKQTYHGHKCYEFILSKPLDWNHAKRDCSAKGGHLVTIESNQEESFLLDYLRGLNYHGKGLWIGLNDKIKEGNFVWDSGKPLVYKNFASDQPDDDRYSHHQDCVLLYVPDHYEQHKGQTYAYYQYTPGWHDRACSDSNNQFAREDDGWICEYEGIHPQPTSHSIRTQPTPAIPYHNGCPVLNTYTSTSLIHGSKCYEFILSKPQDWNTASQDCRGKGGFLVTIENKQEESYLMHYLQTVNYHGKGVWIGLNDKGGEGRFVWESGLKTNFTHWEAGQPDDPKYFRNQDCVLMYVPNVPHHYVQHNNGYWYPVFPDGTPGWHDQACSNWNENDGWICEYYIVPTIPPNSKFTTQQATTATKIAVSTSTQSTTTALPRTPSTVPTTTTTNAPTTTPSKTPTTTPSTTSTTTPSTTPTSTLSTTPTTTPSTTPTSTASSTSTTRPTTASTSTPTSTTPLPFIIGR